MIGNLNEQFLYRLLPEAVLSQDERGYIEAVCSGFQDRLGDLRSYARKLDDFWVPGALPDVPFNVVLVDLTSSNGKTYTRSLDIQPDTPAADSSLLPRWVSQQLDIPVEDLANIRYGYDALRAVDTNTLSWLAATLGALLYQTDLADNTSQVKLVDTWFPRLKIKGTVASFEVLGRILGFDDVRVTPLWTRLSPRVPNDVGDPDNDPDFADSPEYFPRQEIGPFYDPYAYRDGPFFSWTGTASNGTNSTQFYTETITGHNPWISVVLLGSLAGTNVPAISEGTVTHPSVGSYALAYGAPYSKAYVDPPGSSIRFQAIAEGSDFNGLFVHIATSGSMAHVTVDDRLSAIKYRSSYFDLGLTADQDKIEDIFGSRAATTNKDLKANPTLTSDGTSASPYRPWVSGSISVIETTTDWVTRSGVLDTVISARREANPSLHDRQLNMDSVVAAGVQVTQAFEEVRAATRLPRESQAGFLIDNEVCYAPYAKVTDLFTTSAGTVAYSGSSHSTPLPDYVANVQVLFPATFYCSWLAYTGQTYFVHAAYNFGTFSTIGTVNTLVNQQVTFYDPVAGAFAAIYDISTTGLVPVGVITYGLIPTGIIPVKSEINPLNQNEYVYKITTDQTSYTLSGSYNFSTGSYAFNVKNYPGVVIQAVWTLTSTEVIRSEPTTGTKATGIEIVDGDESAWSFSCLARPEDEANGLIYETADDYPWRREIVIGGELVELDTYQSGSEIAIHELEEATAFNDHTGVDINVFGVTSPNTTHPRIVTQPRSTVPGQYKPGYTAIGYRGTIKNLSTLSADDIALIRPPTGSVGDTKTDYDVLFSPGYSLFHVGLAQGVLVADLPKFFGAHHSQGLVGWLAFNEHVDDDLIVVDHSFHATPTVLNGWLYTSRLWDDERGWHLAIRNAEVIADEYRDIVDEITMSFWIRLYSIPTVETRIVDNSPLYFTLNPSGFVTGYAKNADGTVTTVGVGDVSSGSWYFIAIRRSATSAVFRINLTETTVAGAYAQGDPDTDTILRVRAFDSAGFDLHDLRIWNVFKTAEEIALVRYHDPTPTICLYRLGFVYTLDREDKYGIKILPSGWAALDVLPAWYRRTRQGLVLRYDSMGSYIGETRFKEVGIGDQRRLPDTYHLGQQFVSMLAEGTAPFSTDHGQLPGWNPLWQSEYAGTYDVLYFSGSTGTGIVPTVTVSGSGGTWPNTMAQTNPFRQYVYVSTLQGSGVYQLSLDGSQSSTWLEAKPVVHGRTQAEVNCDPYLAILVDTGTVYEAFGTSFIQGTIIGSSGTYGLLNAGTYHSKIFPTTDLYISDMPTGAYVLLSGSGSGVLLAHTGTDRGVVGAYSGSDSTPPLYMYTNSRIVTQVDDANTAWTDKNVTTPAENGVDPADMPSIVTVTAFGTFLTTPALGRAGILEFSANSGTLVAGHYELTVISGQVGQADVDFDGFAVEININDTIFERHLLRGQSGYNFRGTNVFNFTLNDGVYGDYLVSFHWTNPAEDTSRGTKRQLAIFGFRLRHITVELFKVEVLPSMQPLITPLYTDRYNTGTTPGGWFNTINSYGTSVGYKHESDIYTSNDTVTAVYPLGDTLSALTNDRRDDIIYTGSDVVISDPGSFTFPTFGSVSVSGTGSHQVGDLLLFTASPTPSGTTIYSYVWSWWDGSRTATAVPFTTKVVNIGGHPGTDVLAYTCQPVALDGQNVVLSGTITANNRPYVLPGATVSNNDTYFSFQTRLQLQAIDVDGDAFGFAWYTGTTFLGLGTRVTSGAATGTWTGNGSTVLVATTGTTNYIDLSIASDRTVTCYIADVRGGTASVDFALRGLESVAPVASFGAGVSGVDFDPSTPPLVRIGPGQAVDFTVYVAPLPDHTLSFYWTFAGSNHWTMAPATSAGVTTVLANGGYQNTVHRDISTEVVSTGTAKAVRAQVRVNALNTLNGQLSHTDTQYDVTLVKNSAPSSVQITRTINGVPIVGTGPVPAGAQIEFSAVGVDADLDVLFCKWQISQPTPLVPNPIYFWGPKILYDTTGYTSANSVQGQISVTDRFGATLTSVLPVTNIATTA